MGSDEKEPNKIEIFTPRDVRVDRRRVLPGGLRPSQMEKPPDLVAWWRIIRKHRWTVITAFVVLFVTVLIGSFKEKPVYRAKALIEIDKEDPSVANPQELFQVDEVSDAYLETQYKVLGSDDLAERVIHQLGLERNAEFLPSQIHWPWTSNVAHAASSAQAGQNAGAADPFVEDTVLKRFQDRLDVKPVRRSRAVELRFDSRDPELAARTVNAVVDDYIQKNFQARWDSAQKASIWLSQQLQDLKSKLEKSEDDLQKYSADNGLLYLETGKGDSESIVNQTVVGIQGELTKAEADRFEKESIYRLLQAGDFGSLPGVFDNKLLQDLTIRLADLQREHAQLAATFTEEYPKVKEIQGQIIEIQGSLERERARAAQKISNDYFAAVRREKLVRQSFAETQAEANQVAEKSVQYGMLSREVETNKGLYEGLLQRLKEASVSAGLKAGNIRVVDPGRVPFKPIAPNYPLNLGLASVLGLGLGVGMAFLKEHLDQTIRYSEDVFNYLGVPVIGFVPNYAALNKKPPKVITAAEKQVYFGAEERQDEVGGTFLDARSRNDLGIHKGSAFSEAFRELRTSVILSSSGRFANSILVTSAQPGEGKTTVAVNLAFSLAQLGQPVLLVDADMRRPTIQKYFPQRGSRLSSYLSGQGAWQEMVYPTSVRGLSIMHCGPIPENPSELLSSDRMRAMLQESMATYRFVILDSPPLLNRADSRILGSMVSATILVVKGGETPRQVVQYAESQARSVGANLIGVVLNNLDKSMNDYSYYSVPRPKDEAAEA
ncbi:MAG TPA: polysaccharide biosynthesis tyrosine autokinase [Candidatus Acidoferrales bacterium]|nr:polysaccharide biosynthesis tyrosine autokinase [Candidatus Acidoferrales bacterium]